MSSRPARSVSQPVASAITAASGVAFTPADQTTVREVICCSPSAPETVTTSSAMSVTKALVSTRIPESSSVERAKSERRPPYTGSRSPAPSTRYTVAGTSV